MMPVLNRFVARLARGRGLHVQAVAFFALALMAFVFATGGEAAHVAAILPGMVWAVLLLAALLGLGDVLEPDYADGTLDDMVLSPRPLAWLMACKMLAHWLTATLPAALAATLCVYVQVPDAGASIVKTAAALLLGGMAFSAIGIMGAALVLGSRKAATLLAIIVMPLCVPPLIFGAGAAASAQLGLDGTAPFAFLAAFACGAATLAPFAAAAIVRMKVTSP